MDEIRLFFIDTADKEAVEKVQGLVTPEVQAAMDEALPVTVFLAAYGNMAAGAIAGSVTGGIFDIESVYVAPEYRRKGIGTALIERLRRALLTKEIMIRAEYTLDNKEKESLSTFFRRNGFSRERIAIPCYYISSLKDMKNEDEDKIKNKFSGSITPLSEIPVNALKTATAYAKNEGYPLPKGGLLSEKVDRDLSFSVVVNGRVGAYIIVEKDEDGIIEIPALWSRVPDPKIMMAMIKKAVAASLAKYPPEEKAAMMAISSVSEKIILYLFPKAEAVSYTYISQ